MSAGRWLRAQRRLRRLALSTVADRLGIDPVRLLLVEIGRERLTEEELQRARQLFASQAATAAGEPAGRAARKGTMA